MSEPSDEAVTQFMAVTGADASVAAAVLKQTGGDVDAALEKHYEVSSDKEDEVMVEAAPAAAAPAPALPAESQTDLVGSILSNARQEGEDGAAQPKSWGSGAGHVLGSSAESAAGEEGGAGPSAAAVPPVDAAGDRRNAKKARALSRAHTLPTPCLFRGRRM